MKTIINMVALFVVMPIWYYLLYKILTLVGATELMWFLYWIYLPAGIFFKVLSEMTEKK